jgi:hypothetical protein
MRSIASALVLTAGIAASAHAELQLPPGSARAAKPALVRAQPVVPAGDYEQPGYLPAAQFLNPAALAGPGYRVRPDAFCDGLNNSYEVDSDLGYFEVIGGEVLLLRIAEVIATAQLKQVNAGAEYGEAAAQAGESTVRAVGKTISNPLKAIGNLPRGASKFFGSVGEGMKGGKSAYEDKSYTELLGASRAKRELAFAYRVSPYTRTEALQAELNRVGWAKAGGKLTVGAATGAVLPPGVGTGLSINETYQQTLIANDPSQQRILDRKALLALGVTTSEADGILMHPWFSPIHRTIITGSLKSIGATRGLSAVLRLMSTATEEYDAYYFMRCAQLAAKYDAEQRPIRRFIVDRRLISCVDVDGNWVLPLHADYLMWTAPVALRAASLREVKQRSEVSGRTILYTSALLSPRAQRELESRGTACIPGVRINN